MKRGTVSGTVVAVLLIGALASLGATEPRPPIRAGAPLPALELRGNDGGTTDGAPWDTGALSGDTVVILGTPDGIRSVRETTAELESLVEQDRTVSLLMIIDVSRTRLPYGIIRPRLRRTQENRPETRIVVDRRGSAAATWFTDQLTGTPDYARIIAVDRDGTVTDVWDTAAFQRIGAATVISRFAVSTPHEDR